MFVFPEQKEFKVGGVKFGGQMTEPAVLIGTVFYEGQGIDDKRAGQLIDKQEQLSGETGIPAILDVFANSREDAIRRIDFVVERTDGPFLIDIPEQEVRLVGLRHCEEVGLLDRVIYNSINMSIEDGEIEELKLIKPPNVLVLAFNPMDNSLKGRMGLLETGARVIDKGLLGVAGDVGAKRILVDVAATPIHNGAGSSLRAVFVAKSKFCLPTGIGMHNAVSSWTWLKDKSYGDVSSDALARMMGADFVLYGPIEKAERVFPVMALTESLIGEALEEIGLRLPKGHPYKRL
jgi:tetrahydromethanopterin S-methyltransferase subunit H